MRGSEKHNYYVLSKLFLTLEQPPKCCQAEEYEYFPLEWSELVFAKSAAFDA